MNRRQAVKFRPAVAQERAREQETKVFAKNEVEEFEDSALEQKSRPRAGDRLKAIARVAEAGRIISSDSSDSRRVEVQNSRRIEQLGASRGGEHHCAGCRCPSFSSAREENEEDDLDEIIAKLRIRKLPSPSFNS